MHDLMQRTDELVAEATRDIDDLDDWAHLSADQLDILRSAWELRRSLTDDREAVYWLCAQMSQGAHPTPLFRLLFPHTHPEMLQALVTARLRAQTPLPPLAREALHHLDAPPAERRALIGRICDVLNQRHIDHKRALQAAFAQRRRRLTLLAWGVLAGSLLAGTLTKTPIIAVLGIPVALWVAALRTRAIRGRHRVLDRLQRDYRAGHSAERLNRAALRLLQGLPGEALACWHPFPEGWLEETLLDGLRGPR